MLGQATVLPVGVPAATVCDAVRCAPQVKGYYAVTYDLQVTTLQALTLLVFNRRSTSVRTLSPLSLPLSLVCVCVPVMPGCTHVTEGSL